MSVKVKYLIIGAGPTAFGAAYRLKELGISDFLVLEASSHVGGLARSVKDPQGFIWDIGGHVHFSHYKYYDDALDAVMGKDAFYSHVRNSQIWIKNRFVPYPFQNNIHKLPAATQAQCLLGLLRTVYLDKKTKPTSFRNWIERSFGPGISDVFMLPYNKKVWAHDPSELGTEWMGDRVPKVKVGEIIKNTFLRKDLSTWGPNNYFRFPVKGGTGAIWEAMGSFVGPSHIKLNAEVTEIDADRKIAQAAGESYEYETLINTIPLRTLTSLVKGISPGAKEAASRLKFSTSHIVGIGLKGQPPEFIRPIGWMYFPQSDIPFYRATILSNYSQHVAPDPDKTWSLMLESSESKTVNTGFDNAIDKCAAALLRIGFIKNKSDILSTWYTKAPYGYPTPHIGRDDILFKVQPELESKNIYSRGRFGGWKYEVSNQDHSFMQGVELIDRLVQGKPEVTYITPDVANEKKR